MPRLAAEFLKGRAETPGCEPRRTRRELDDAFDAALGLVCRLLVLFYADVRQLIPGRTGRTSLHRLRAVVAAALGTQPNRVPLRARTAFADDRFDLARAIGKLLAPLENAGLGLDALGQAFLPGSVATRTARELGRHSQSQRRMRCGSQRSNRRPRGFCRGILPSDRVLARVIDALARDAHPVTGQLVPVAYESLDVRVLGSLYERLLGVRLRQRARGRSSTSASQASPFVLEPDRPGRKALGRFYTPEHIVRHIVEQTLGPILDERLRLLRSGLEAGATRSHAAAGWLDRVLNVRVLDPAMGAGHFLVDTVRYISGRVIDCLNDLPRPRALRTVAELRATSRGNGRRRAAATDRMRRADSALIQQAVLERCAYGIDLDSRAAAIARAILCLDAALPPRGPGALDEHLRCADALLDAPFGTTRFDAVVGNPPYGAWLAPGMRARLRTRLPQMRHNSDTAVGFIERSSALVHEAGRVGLIVPKALTYSFAWRRVREFLHRRIEHLADVSRAWRDVRLEQVIVIFGPETATAGYRSARASDHGRKGSRTMPWLLARRFDTLPCALAAVEMQRLSRLQFSDATLGDIGQTYRGLAAQRLLAPCGETPVIGGRDIERWHIRSRSGFLSAPPNTFNLAPFEPEKLVIQNIVAHITRPVPHIRIIAAYDARGTVTLDTVNNLVVREPSIHPRGVLALLHADLINWFLYAVIYNKAIRTMHFDQYFLDRIPLPVGFDELLARLAPIAEQCEAATRRMAELVRAFRGRLEQETGIDLSARRASSLLATDQPPGQRAAAAPGIPVPAAIAELCTAIAEPFRAEVRTLAEERWSAGARLNRLVDQAYRPA